MRERALLNAFREVRTRLLQKSKSDNIVVLVSSIAENGGGTFVAFNLAATFALDRHKTALYVDCNPYLSTAEKYSAKPVEQGIVQLLKEYNLPIKRSFYQFSAYPLRFLP